MTFDRALARQVLERAQIARADRPGPILIGVAGSVAVGKSTITAALETTLSAEPPNPHVDLVTTDDFLLPNRELETRGLLAHKGFPDSYDIDALTTFLQHVRAGVAEIAVPVYSHAQYDIIDGEFQYVVGPPDVVIVEGVNALRFADYYDVSIYVDADELDIERWFVDRLVAVCRAESGDPDSFFHQFAGLDEAATEAMARGVWHMVNGVNLREYILPTRDRADLVLRKGPDHRIVDVAWSG